MKTFQYNLPVFIKNPSGLTSAGRHYKQGQHYPWLEVGVDVNKVQILFNNGYVYHNVEFEKELKSVGDGLESLGTEELEELVRNINKKVKDNTRNETEYRKKRCRESTILDKQRGHIRRWRSLYGEMENL